MPSSARDIVLTGLLCVTTACALCAQVTGEAIMGAQTISYCEVLEHPEKFKDRMIRVRVLYETDFEKSAITAPACNVPFMTWVDFDKQWEARSKRRVRHALSRQKWGVQADVVFIGLFKSDGPYGHMDMYPFSIEVFKVETTRPSGSFRPLPDNGRMRDQ